MPPRRYHLVRRPNGSVGIWHVASAGLLRLVVSGMFSFAPYVPLKAGPFDTREEAEAARRRWEEPPRG